MTDDRWPEDTLFMLLEEDFRFWPSTHEDLEPYLVRGERVYSGGPRCPEGEPTATHPLAQQKYPKDRRHKGKGKGLTPGVATSYHRSQVKGSCGPEHGPDWGLQREVADLLRMACAAHRQGRGDIMWCTYCCQNKSQYTLTNGTMMMMLSKAGASAILQALHEPTAVTCGHIDLMLKEWLKKRAHTRLQEEIGFSIFWPPVGHFSAHASDCDPKKFGSKGIIREAQWGQKWTCMGTRVSDDILHAERANRLREKWTCQFTPKGGSGNWMPFPKDEDLHETDIYVWKSWEDKKLLPTEDSSEPTATASSAKKPRGSAGIGWPAGNTSAGSRSQSSSSKGPVGPNMATCKSPPLLPPKHGRPGPAPPGPPSTPCLSPQVGGGEEQADLTAKRERMFRSQRARYNRRVWAHNRSQAGVYGSQIDADRTSRFSSVPLVSHIHFFSVLVAMEPTTFLGSTFGGLLNRLWVLGGMVFCPCVCVPMSQQTTRLSVLTTC